MAALLAMAFSLGLAADASARSSSPQNTEADGDWRLRLRDGFDRFLDEAERELDQARRQMERSLRDVPRFDLPYVAPNGDIVIPRRRDRSRPEDQQTDGTDI